MFVDLAFFSSCSLLCFSILDLLNCKWQDLCHTVFPIKPSTLRSSARVRLTGNMTSSFETLPYIKSTSEMAARLLRPFNINVAHKPIHKLRSYFTKRKDNTSTTETKNAIYMIPCGDRPQRYIGQT